MLGSFEPVIATLGILGTLICWFEWHRILQLAEKIFQSKKTILNKVLAFADNVALTFKLDNLDLIRATGLSTLMHFMHIYMYYIIALSLNVDINFSYLCVVVPIVNVASSLPISINGIGVRESLLILLLSQHLSSAGTTIAPETAVLIGILVTFIVTMVSGIGGVLCSMLKRS